MGEDTLRMPAEPLVGNQQMHGALGKSGKVGIKQFGKPRWTGTVLEGVFRARLQVARMRGPDRAPVCRTCRMADDNIPIAVAFHTSKRKQQISSKTYRKPVANPSHIHRELIADSI